MRPDSRLCAIADLVARAECVKRNREIILRSPQTKPAASPASTSPATFSPDSGFRAYLGAVAPRDPDVDPMP